MSGGIPNAQQQARRRRNQRRVIKGHYLTKRRLHITKESKDEEKQRTKAQEIRWLTTRRE